MCCRQLQAKNLHRMNIRLTLSTIKDLRYYKNKATESNGGLILSYGFTDESLNFD